MNKNIYKSGLAVLLCLQLLFILLIFICDDSFSVISLLAFIGLCPPCVILAILSLRWSKQFSSHRGKVLSIVSLCVEIPFLAFSVFLIVTTDAHPTVGALLLFAAELLVPLAMLFLLQKRPRCSNTPPTSDTTPLPRIPRKALIFGGIIIAIVAALLIAVPSKNERIAISSVQHLQSSLKDPGSLTLRGDIYVLSSDDNPLVLIHYSARNSFGGMVSEYAFFDEYGYLGDSEGSIDGLSSPRRERYVDARLYMSLYKSTGISPTGNKSVSGRRIASVVGCSYSKN